MTWNLSFYPLVTNKHLALLSLQTCSGRWADDRKVGDGSREPKENNQAVAQPQLLGSQNYPALTSKKSKVENTTRKTLDAKDSSSLSTEYTV